MYNWNINVCLQNNSIKHPEGFKEIKVTQDPVEGLDSLDNQAFLGNQEDKEDQVIFNKDLYERTNILQQ